MASLLEVENLTVAFRTRGGLLRAVERVNMTVNEGDVFAIVGESGCGKSTLAYSLLRLIPDPGFIETGRIQFDGIDLAKISESQLRQIRAQQVSMVFQASMNSFNPVLTIRRQLSHVLEAHPKVWVDKRAGLSYMEELLNLVHLEPRRVLDSYPHQLSGGMKQRVAIAMGLVLRPKLLILDEPTTALDVLNQRLVLDILKKLHEQLQLTVIFVTHDLAIVADVANRVGVMYAGRMAEIGTLDQVFYSPMRHPYVQGLLRAAPSAFSTVRAQSIPGAVPNLLQLHPGCRFAPRCPLVEPSCREREPEIEEVEENHWIRCDIIRQEALAK